MNNKLEGWALLIDSDIDRLKFVSQTLISAGMRVSCAKSLDIASSFLKGHRPDIVLVHSCLFKALLFLSSLPVLLMSSGDEGEDALEGFFDAGIRDVIQIPPPIPRVLYSRVANLLAAERPLAVGDKDVPKKNAGSLPKVEGISYDEALKNCGSEDVLKEVFQKFYDSIEEKISGIEAFVAAGNWKDYRISVHSLKTSARLIGAAKLSEDAKELEYAANYLRTDEIVEKTPALVSLYRSYREKLLPFVQVQEEQAQEGEMLSEKDFLAACSDLRECITISDFDSADFIVKSLSEYKIPDERKDFMARLKKAVGDVNRQEVLSLLSNILSISAKE